ncbi:MAG: FMN phosphatase YigB (HAD superfamily) [Bermanella sp.]|jgi:FMN phosphatase YigB (HAD superfamily)
MAHVIFDVDNTLIMSHDFDEACFLLAVQEITGMVLLNNWDTYPHITNTGILQTFIERQAPHYCLADLVLQVKKVLTQNIKQNLCLGRVKEVPGARAFFHSLISNPNFDVSIATGGWSETAKLKLDSAGFEIRNVNMVSSDDHFSIVEIIKKASNSLHQDVNVTYFGDADWDVKACRSLGINLVIVGERVNYFQSIKDFRNSNEILSYIL